ncbi:MAG: hypothetical protein ACOYJ1_13905 [Peptococcales bacterium]|jgi:hypothetical protein
MENVNIFPFQTRQGFPTASVQFECGCCCKKVFGENVMFDEVSGSLVISGDNLTVLTFSGGRLINKQTLEEIEINPMTRVCTMEFNTTELDTNTPIAIGVSPLAVEVDCGGGCCKKILNAQEVLVGPQFTLVTGAGLLYILTFNQGNLVSLQTAAEANVLNSRVCSVEKNVTEIPLPQPSTRGVSFFSK